MSKEKLVKDTISMSQEISYMSVDKINELAPKPQETELRLTAKQKASDEGVMYVEPKRKLPGFGKLPEKQVEEHRKAWEYVKGIYENYIVNGEPVKFWFCKYAGDPDCLWEIPCNVPVYVPRMIAQHLEEVQKYHSFSQLAPTAEPLPMAAGDVESMRWFYPSGTHYRGKFRPIGAFA